MLGLLLAMMNFCLAYIGADEDGDSQSSKSAKAVTLRVTQPYCIDAMRLRSSGKAPESPMILGPIGRDFDQILPDSQRNRRLCKEADPVKEARGRRQHDEVSPLLTMRSLGCGGSE